ncbi:hypothetical protein CCMSSC00406_0003615 [Pleurotus cornucopiae]|uniref:Uncharacterized protein n=1 Tax=Pleurotus cornucopiae TaxID=5321 RepID=A0ACB7IIJ9_PLECO|nr:hypothetical protein CCMSSC00406_0003615 [Pleurotus cornucopiae]
MIVATAPQPQPEDVPVERWQYVACSDVCYVLSLFITLFVIFMITFGVICILQRESTIIQMFELNTRQYHGDIFNGPIRDSNIGGEHNQNTSTGATNHGPG